MSEITEEMGRAAENTDRELWRERSGLPADSDNYYAPSIHVTAQGGIGINVGGYVVVKSLREWHALAASPDQTNGLLREALVEARAAIDSLDVDALGWADMSDRYTGDAVDYPIRDELLAKIDAALASTPTARIEESEPTPFGYAYRYPHWPPEGATVIRFGTSGREINGRKPIETIPLYTREQIEVLRSRLMKGE